MMLLLLSLLLLFGIPVFAFLFIIVSFLFLNVFLVRLFFNLTPSALLFVWRIFYQYTIICIVSTFYRLLRVRCRCEHSTNVWRFRYLMICAFVIIKAKNRIGSKQQSNKNQVFEFSNWWNSATVSNLAQTEEIQLFIDLTAYYAQNDW